MGCGWSAQVAVSRALTALGCGCGSRGCCVNHWRRYRHGFTPAPPPKRTEREVWGPSGRGVLQGWYTPRVTTPEVRL
eukprot:COSAG01_NODE_30375_length_617_cov_0.735521_1_plen_76_part_10